MTANDDGTRQQDLALDFGATAADDVARRARQLLIENKFVMSGDSGLRNAWEEIVVQVRGEQTPFWDAYEAAMHDAVLTALAVGADPILTHPADPILTRGWTSAA